MKRKIVNINGHGKRRKKGMIGKTSKNETEVET